MTILDIILISLGLAMDCFAVSIANGISCRNNVSWWRIARMALFFGVFQGLMPLVGWLLGVSFAEYISTYAHWMALVILGALGLKMIYGSLKHDDEDADAGRSPLSSIPLLIVFSFATSIDALASGLVFVPHGMSVITYAVASIGLSSFVLTLIGFYLGRHYGYKFNLNAELIGGLILIGIGIKIFIEHSI